MATWEVETKRMRGKARKNPAPEYAPTQIDVVFDQEFFDMRTGTKIRGKTYDTMEEAIEELGDNVVRRILQDGETVPVRVNITVNQWRE